MILLSNNIWRIPEASYLNWFYLVSNGGMVQLLLFVFIVDAENTNNYYPIY